MPDVYPSSNGHAVLPTDLLAEGRKAFPKIQLTLVEHLQEVLLSEIAVAGMDSPPVEVRALFENFLHQLTLPRCTSLTWSWPK